MKTHTITANLADRASVLAAMQTLARIDLGDIHFWDEATEQETPRLAFALAGPCELPREWVAATEENGDDGLPVDEVVFAAAVAQDKAAREVARDLVRRIAAYNRERGSTLRTTSEIPHGTFLAAALAFADAKDIPGYVDYLHSIELLEEVWEEAALDTVIAKHGITTTTAPLIAARIAIPGQAGDDQVPRWLEGLDSTKVVDAILAGWIASVRKTDIFTEREDDRDFVRHTDVAEQLLGYLPKLNESDDQEEIARVLMYAALRERVVTSGELLAAKKRAKLVAELGVVASDDDDDDDADDDE